MRFRVTLSWAVLLWGSVSCLAQEGSNQRHAANEDLPSAKDLLRRASELVSQQGKDQHIWTMGTLLQIGELQLRAGDLEGARMSIRPSTDSYGSNAALIRLAEGLAAAGKRKESLDVLRELGSDHGWKQTLINDGVRLRWIEHLIAAGDFTAAQVEARGVESKERRSHGFRALAMAYAKSGDHAQAAAHFQLGLDAIEATNDYDHACALWELAQAQLSVGAADGAKVTTGQLVAAAKKMEAWAKVAALRESAVLFADLKDRPAASSAFRQAIEASQGVESHNKVGAVKLIAMAQARVGYIEDALNTARMITHRDAHFGQDGDREGAMLSIAEAQLQAGDADGAVHTALSVTYFLQYRDEALHAVVEDQIKQGNFMKALRAAEKVHNPSRRASAMLKTATAYANTGNKRGAYEIASRIELRGGSNIFGKDPVHTFDYRRPESWLENYDQGGGSTALSREFSNQRAAELAVCAMRLARAIALQPELDYGKLLDDDAVSEEVIFALARAHGAHGCLPDALAWSRRIGDDHSATSKEDGDEVWSLRRRIYTLIAVVEGMLDRSDAAKTAASR